MRNYIRADIKRILGHTSRTLSILLALAIYFSVIYFPNKDAQVTSVSLVSSACSALEWVFLLLGLFELIAVFSEDFKVKTMQVAIGLGLSRSKVVICKLVEVAILLLLDCIVLLVMTLGVGAVFGVTVPAAVMLDLLNMLVVKGLLATVVFTSLTMTVLFTTQSTILSIFVYALISVGTVNGLLTLAPMFGFDWLEDLRLSRITLSYNIGAFHTRLALGTFDIIPFLIILVHLAAGIFATCKLFGKRELDF